MRRAGAGWAGVPKKDGGPVSGGPSPRPGLSGVGRGRRLFSLCQSSTLTFSSVVPTWFSLGRFLVLLKVTSKVTGYDTYFPEEETSCPAQGPEQRQNDVRSILIHHNLT